MMLSRHFALNEFTDSVKARTLGISNTPSEEDMARLSKTAAHMEEVRELLGRNPIKITSGYRSPKLNAAVGGSKKSQHTTGEAVDFVCPDFGTPEEIIQAIVDSDIEYDQCILEYPDRSDGGWIHVSFTKSPRLQALLINDQGTHAYA